MTAATLVKTKAIAMEDRGREFALRCPRCGNTYLHQGKVAIYERAEDAAEVLLTVVDNGTTTTSLVPPSEENPSDRRQGMVISFHCELCPDSGEDPRIELTIAQHKGETFVQWRHTPAAVSRRATG